MSFSPFQRKSARRGRRVSQKSGRIFGFEGFKIPRTEIIAWTDERDDLLLFTGAFGAGHFKPFLANFLEEGFPVTKPVRSATWNGPVSYPVATPGAKPLISNCLAWGNAHHVLCMNFSTPSSTTLAMGGGRRPLLQFFICF